MVHYAWPTQAAVYFLIYEQRDANQGACTNACRWDYKLHEAQEDLNGDVIPVTQLNTPEKSCCSSDNQKQPRFKLTRTT